MPSRTNGRGTLFVGGLAAVLASTCCLGPVVLLMLGISGAWIANLTLLEPYRPIFIGVAAGRMPEIDDLKLDAAGVIWDQQGVAVNEYLQSVSNPTVYAAGDAAASGAPRLTPVAGYQGRIVAANLLDEQKQQSPDYAVVPSVVFTVPPLASVGLLEHVAHGRGLAFDVHQGNTASWHSSRRVGETHSGFKVLVERSSGRILGAHVLGPRADDVINLFAMAMHTGTTAASLKEILFAYPTAESDIPYMV
jgi:glutathione reductase (NADPH)